MTPPPSVKVGLDRRRSPTRVRVDQTEYRTVLGAAERLCEVGGRSEHPPILPAKPCIRSEAPVGCG